MSRKTVVMYLPCRGDPAKLDLISADLLPHEFTAHHCARRLLDTLWTPRITTR